MMVHRWNHEHIYKNFDENENIKSLLSSAKAVYTGEFIALNATLKKKKALILMTYAYTSRK